MLALALLEDWDCKTCTAKLKRERGCDAPPMLPMELDGEELQRCPRLPLLKTPVVYSEVLWLYGRYEKGILPEGANLGIYGQPNKLIQMFRVIEGALSDAQRELESRSKK